ncbi:MAG TPA: hypothetical protein VGH11_04245 [Jatrophihabitans sp.]|jgi:hypothetical protein
MLRSTSTEGTNPLRPYREQQRIADILVAIEAIRAHLLRETLSEGLLFDVPL